MNEDFTSFAGNPMVNSLLDSLPKEAASSFSMANLVWGLLFGSVGFIAFSYGKGNAKMYPMILGIALMAFPYFVRGTLMLVLIGLGLCGALFILRD